MFANNVYLLYYFLTKFRLVLIENVSCAGVYALPAFYAKHISNWQKLLLAGFIFTFAFGTWSTVVLLSKMVSLSNCSLTNNDELYLADGSARVWTLYCSLSKFCG